MKKIIAVGLGFMGLPLLAFAQTGFATGSTLGSILVTVKRLMDLLIPIFITLGLLFFLYGLAEYVMASGEEEKVKEGRNKMIYGVVALFVMVSVWGLVGVVSRTFQVPIGVEGTLPGVPTIQYQGI